MHRNDPEKIIAAYYVNEYQSVHVQQNAGSTKRVTKTPLRVHANSTHKIQKHVLSSTLHPKRNIGNGPSLMQIEQRR